MKFIIFNSECCGFSDNLDNKYFNILSKFYNIKRVKQNRFNTIISINSLNDILDIVKLVKHSVIIENELNPFLGVSLPVLHIYDDYIE